ncbi:MAG: peptidylprolyl isomerase [bacterium]|nr:MAG: peptidylprolyl isomerase [bacterium]
MKRILITVCCAVFTLLLIGGCSRDDSGGEGADTLAGGRSAETRDPSIVALVNGRAITISDVDQQVKVLEQDPMVASDQEERENRTEWIRKLAFGRVVGRILLEEAIEREGVHVPPQAVDARMGEIISGYASEVAFKERLAKSGLTFARFREEAEKSMRIEALIDVHIGPIRRPSDTEVRKYYDDNIMQFFTPEYVKASHILFRVDETDGESEKETKRFRMEAILEEIKAGADFAEMATRYSECPTADKGGDLGFFRRGEMVDAFQAAAFALEVNEISDVVETIYGFHIIKVTDRQKEYYTPFEEIRDNLATYIYKKKKQDAMDRYMKKLRASATIEYFDPEFQQ